MVKERAKSRISLSALVSILSVYQRITSLRTLPGKSIAEGDFVHYPNEKWFPLTEDDSLPEGLLDNRLIKFMTPITP